ncbi:MAG: ZIP family metal transporter [Bacteroidales bacterium]|nr:ZIP family metal transporter [Bacteroidales bacterium]
MISIIIAILIPFIGTTLGSAFVFFMKKQMSSNLQKLLLGFASGVMVAASVWSLLIPSLEVSVADSWQKILPTSIGFMAGIGFLLLIDYITPHFHVNTSTQEGIKCHLSKTSMLSLAVTIHNLPEGMAVGVVIAGALQNNLNLSISAAITMSLGIAIQNIPEGAIISMPMKAEGNSRMRSFILGTLSGAVEPLGAVLMILLSNMISPMMPYLLSFAAGAMMYVVVEELIPEASSGKHSNLSTIGFAVGFVLMMIMDVMFG